MASRQDGLEELEEPASRGVTMETYNVDFWEERDRLGIWVADTRNDKTVFEVWDGDARQLFIDGFFKPGARFEDSVINYLKEIGVIPCTPTTAAQKRG